jgi:hypothetical protein
MDTTEMNLDDIREILYAFNKHLLGIIEDGNIEDLYEHDMVEETVEEFLSRNEELTGHLKAASEEESY